MDDSTTRLEPCLLRTKLRIVYLQSKQVRWVIENPTTSLLFQYKCIRDTCWQVHFFCFHIMFLSCGLSPKSRCFFGCIAVFEVLSRTSPVFPSATKKLIKRFNATVVTVHLGAYGAFTLKPVPSLKLCFFNAVGMSLPFCIEVTLVGTVEWLRDLKRTLDKPQKESLQRIRKFLKVETTKQYKCKKTGKVKCVRFSHPL